MIGWLVGWFGSCCCCCCCCFVVVVFGGVDFFSVFFFLGGGGVVLWWGDFRSFLRGEVTVCLVFLCWCFSPWLLAYRTGNGGAVLRYGGEPLPDAMCLQGVPIQGDLGAVPLPEVPVLYH